MTTECSVLGPLWTESSDCQSPLTLCSAPQVFTGAAGWRGGGMAILLFKISKTAEKSDTCISPHEGMFEISHDSSLFLPAPIRGWNGKLVWSLGCSHSNISYNVIVCSFQNRFAQLPLLYSFLFSTSTKWIKAQFTLWFLKMCDRILLLWVILHKIPSLH